MSADVRPIEVGDRFEDKDPRQGNRVVRVTFIGGSEMRVEVKVEVAELNPKALGRTYWIKAQTLRTRYQRVSR